MGRRKKRKVKLVTDEQLEEAFGLQPAEDKGREEDARAMVVMYTGDIIRTLLEVMDQQEWSKRLEAAREAQLSAESLVEECEAMVPEADTKENCPHDANPESCVVCDYEAARETDNNNHRGVRVRD